MREAIIAWLTWLAADPAAIDQEAPRASAAVSVAYAQFATEAAPQPAPEPPRPGCCTDCGGKGVIVHGDGHRTPCPCPASCRCKSPAGATLTPGGPAGPAGQRTR
jgi:hypothetical protein